VGGGFPAAVARIRLAGMPRDYRDRGRETPLRRPASLLRRVGGYYAKPGYASRRCSRTRPQPNRAGTLLTLAMGGTAILANRRKRRLA